MEKNKEIKKAQEELDYLTGDEEERRLAELREKAIRDEISGLNGARKKEKLEIAKRMKEEGIDAQLIQKITGLSPEEVEKL